MRNLRQNHRFDLAILMALICGLGSISTVGLASMTQADLNQFLNRFYKDTKQIMWEIPAKRDANDNVLTHVRSPFPEKEIASRKYVVDRDTVRRNFCRVFHGKKDCLKDRHRPVRTESVLSEMAPQDRPEDLVEAPYIYSSVGEMDDARLHEGRLSKMPWSDTYWPNYEGGLGYRYADNRFPNSEDWFQNLSYIREYNALNLVQSGSDPDKLSPSEKYDLLVGDNRLALTEYNWEQGLAYYNASGVVPTWTGICQGWSAAAIFDPDPLRSVQVVAANGTPITFYASDIRGLSSLLWTTGSPPVRFIGDRCDEENPATDANGRILDEACFNTNPGTWHVSIVNEIGVNHRPFVMDSAYDYQIWNQPVVGYKYMYFNPQTGIMSDSSRDAAIPMSEFSRDRFGAYRSPNTQYVVGVSMEVTYVTELDPIIMDGHRSALTKVNYVYDLELDGNGTILGGEWYENAHPDFLWIQPDQSRAYSAVDGGLDPYEWSGHGPIPSDWMPAAQQVSPNGQPLAAIVERLIERSRQ